MFGIKVLPCRTRKPEADLLSEAAQSIAQHCLRDRVTMPADPNNPEASLQDADSGGRLPPVSCAFRGCTWCVTPSSSTDTAMRDDPGHPWGQLLRGHVLMKHGQQLQEIVVPFIGRDKAMSYR